MTSLGSPWVISPQVFISRLRLTVSDDIRPIRFLRSGTGIRTQDLRLMRPAGTTGLPYPASGPLVPRWTIPGASGRQVSNLPVSTSQMWRPTPSPLPEMLAQEPRATPQNPCLTGPTRRTLLMWRMFVNSFPTSNIFDLTEQPNHLFTPDPDPTRGGSDRISPATVDPAVQGLRVQAEKVGNLPGLVKLMLQLDHHASHTRHGPADQTSAPKSLPRSTY